MNDWIKVTDRMPELPDKDWCDVLVLVCINGNRSSARYYDRSVVRGKRVERWKYLWGRISDENITHWMPLPEPAED